MSGMATEHPKIEHRLPNGDVLIIATTKRDPEVDAVFDAAVKEARQDIRRRFLAFRAAQRAA